MTVNVDLSAQTTNITVTRGDAWAAQMRLTDKASGDPLDLTGSAIVSQLRPSANSEDFTDLDIAATDLADGTFHVGQQAAVDGGVYDIQITPPSGLPRTYVGGRLTVRADVTR